MNIRIYARESAAHQISAARAFKAGLKRFGINAEIDTSNHYRPSDLAVFWGHRQHRVIQGQWSIKRDYLVMERGYIGDRFQYTSLGFNGLNGHARFYAPDTPERGTRFYDLIKPWNDDGEYYLICGQVIGDASLNGVDYPGWIMSIPREIDGVPVLFRPHPVRFGYAVPHRLTDGSLEHDMAGAIGAITYNSNSAVDALLAGVPAVAYNPGSMVYKDVGHEIGDWKRPDREKVVNRLAWCQWTLEEIAAGDAWEHLRQRYDHH